MDKRWIYILIILIIGVGCLYLVVESSTTLGSANVYVNKFTVSVPHSFNVDESGRDYVDLINRHSHEKIRIQDFGKGNNVTKALSEKRDSLSTNENVTLIENIDIKIEGNNYPAIHYEKFSGNTNYAVCVLLHNHTFIIDCSDFPDYNTVKTTVKEIIDSLKPDYKQKQD